MKNTSASLSPDDIRSIRRNLGLTQVQAGELIGGGPRAFAKYESGTVKPAAAVVTLLRLLEAHPEVMTKRPRRRGRPMIPGDVGPFEVTHLHVAALDAQHLPRLLERLLRSEVHALGLPFAESHVSLNINAPDGGEDGRIAWKGGPDPTGPLPRRLCQFQLKAGDVKPGSAGAEVLTRQKTVKPMVRSVLEGGGCYIMLCAHAYSRASIENREARIRHALRGAGLEVQDGQVSFRDANDIAEWINRHPSVAAWLKELTQRGTLGPFCSWTDWSGRSEHDLIPFVADERLPRLRDFLHERVTEPRGVARVLGLAGIGKSRLVLEALGPLYEDEVSGFSPSDMVLYADESEVGSEAVINTVDVLGSGEQCAVVVVDSCPLQTHRILQGRVLRSDSRLSLLTVDHDVHSGSLDQDTFRLGEAPASVTDALVELVSPGLPSEDRRRIERFSAGFPRVAVLVGQAWLENHPPADATDEHLVDAFVLGRNPRDEERLLRSAELLAAFGLVGIHPPDGGDLDEIAARGRDLAATDLHAHIQDLVDRGIAQRRGGAVLLKPHPIAMKLATRQWRRWREPDWDDVLVGDGSADLKVLAARQLAWLNTTSRAREVVIHVSRRDGPLDGRERISAPGHAGVLPHLAEIGHGAVAELIERCLDDVEEPSMYSGEVRGELAFALERIAFHPSGFDSGARLLLRLAAPRGNEFPENARGRFESLFPVHLGNTAADGAARLAFLAEAIETADLSQRHVLVDALSAGSRTGPHFSRWVGAETHGSLPAMDSWQPATRDEYSAYIGGCVDLLIQLAMRDDHSGMEARRSLGSRLRGLVDDGFIDKVERVVGRVGSVADPWPEALESLNHFLIYDAATPEAEAAVRVRALMRQLTPEGLQSQVRLLVTEMPWDYLDDGSMDFAARDDRQVEAVRSLAARLIATPGVLAGILPEVSRGSQRMAYVFGRALAELSDSPLAQLEPIASAVLEAPEETRNF